MDGIETGQSAVKIGYMYLPTHCSLPLSLSLSLSFPRGNGKSSYEYGIVALFLARSGLPANHAPPSLSPFLSPSLSVGGYSAAKSISYAEQ